MNRVISEDSFSSPVEEPPQEPYVDQNFQNRSVEKPPYCGTSLQQQLYEHSVGQTVLDRSEENIYQLSTEQPFFYPTDVESIPDIVQPLNETIDIIPVRLLQEETTLAVQNSIPVADCSEEESYTDEDEEDENLNANAYEPKKKTSMRMNSITNKCSSGSGCQSKFITGI